MNLQLAVEAEPALGPVVGSGWHDLVVELLPNAKRAGTLAALLPPRGEHWPSVGALSDILPEWREAAAGNIEAIDAYCAWGVIQHGIGTTDVLDALDQLLIDPARSTGVSRLAEVFERLLAGDNTDNDERRIYRWIDKLADGGDRRFKQMQQAPGE